MPDQAAEVLDQEVVSAALVALIDCRDFLGYQLAHASGQLGDAELERLAEKYLVEATAPRSELKKAAAVLISLVPANRMDSDLLSVLLRCDLDTAASLLKEYCEEAT